MLSGLENRVIAPGLFAGGHSGEHRRAERARLGRVRHPDSPPFDAERVLRGIQAACGKRPVAEDVKIELVTRLEDELHREFDREVPSEEIGRRVATALRGIDQIAYIRYASEYEQFRSVEDIADIVDELRQRPPELPNQKPLFDE